MDNFYSPYVPTQTVMIPAPPATSEVCMKCGALVSTEQNFRELHRDWHVWMQTVHTALQEVGRVFEEWSFEGAGMKTQEILNDIESKLKSANGDGISGIPKP